MLCSSNQLLLLSFQLDKRASSSIGAYEAIEEDRMAGHLYYIRAHVRRQNRKKEKNKSNDEIIVNRSFHLFIFVVVSFLLNLISLIDCWNVCLCVWMTH